MFLYEEDRKKEEHAVKILFYDTKSYDKESFEAKAKDYPDIQIEYLKSELVPSTAKLAKGYDAICAFVSSDVGTETIDVLSACGVKLILMRCAGFNNVDVEKATACGIKVMRVPGYSPEAVAEHAMGTGTGCQPENPQSLCESSRKRLQPWWYAGSKFLPENSRYRGNR